MRKLLIIVMVICLVLAGYFGCQLATRYFEDKELKDTYEKVRKERKGDRINWEKLKKINPDIIGWIRVKGTHIDYPVVQGKDNEEYLHKDVHGKKASGGSIFADCSCRPGESDNFILFGHHMRNGAMFADMIKFRKSSFAKKHKIVFYTPGHTYWLTVFSAFAEEETTELPITFATENDKREYIRQVKAKSDISAERVVGTMFTFVTCSYEGDNYRTYVYAMT